MIYADGVKKYFKKTVKRPGMLGSVEALFRPKTELVKAVDGVSFHVPEGEILGFIGPNGAGKSTVIKMLTGILTPTGGGCRINGYNPQKQRAEYVKGIGVVFGQRTQLWWDLPLTESFAVLKELYGVGGADFKSRMAALDETLGLSEFIKSPVRTLSLGQRMRADIAAALLHRPKVVFLDEPTIGLDVLVKENIRGAILKMNKEDGTTFILTTHDISDIELLCERIVMIDRGVKVFDGSLKNLKDNYGQTRRITFEALNPGEVEKLNFQERFNVGAADASMESGGKSTTVSFNVSKIPVGDILSYILSTVHAGEITVGGADTEEIVKRLYKGGFAADE